MPGTQIRTSEAFEKAVVNLDQTFRRATRDEERRYAECKGVDRVFKNKVTGQVIAINYQSGQMRELEGPSN